MRFKNFNILLVTGLILLSLAGLSFAADSVEYRSSVLEYYYEDFGDYGYGIISPWSLDSVSMSGVWPVLYFDMKSNLWTEFIYFDTYDVDDLSFLDPGHLNIFYNTSPALKKYEYEWSQEVDLTELFGSEDPVVWTFYDTFGVIGFFGKPYVTLSSNEIFVFQGSELYYGNLF
ncbi:hypothetical protein MmiAt1_02890 [Methanimicrococcus sp. At1]|uniref:Uncharacterized protein n=1 Tax=Methanimicrococcus hacksteinii TaxID=3028293 RepID=A0ABU3VMY8_9EURY|nr:hypothetical protein [Methanimicrococcus sp. At1]MDV0444752.1 hypothetical protein [Methanimicrococcus sp. At1]